MIKYLFITAGLQKKRRRKEEENVYDALVGPSKESQNLEQAIGEIFSTHENYYKMLKLLKVGFTDKAEHSLVKYAFNLLEVDSLMNCHLEMLKELELLKIDYKQIDKIFERLHDHFLSYALYSSQQQNFKNFIADRMGTTLEIAEEVMFKS